MKKIPCLLSALLFTFSITSILTISHVSAQVITASGCSVSNVGYLTELAKEFERQTGIKVFVRGGGSVVGLEDLRGGRIDFAASCKTPLPDESKDLQFIQVAWDALVFIVHKSNPLGNISLNDVRAIYASQITNYKQLKGRDAPIKLFISRPKRGLSGVEKSTKELILEGKDPVETSNTVFLASTGIVEQMVENTPEGFAATGFSSARKRNVKMLKVNNVPPTKENIISGKYPFRRPLYLVITKKPKSEVKKFIDFALSRQGQQFISSQGIPSLMDIK